MIITNSPLPYENIGMIIFFIVLIPYLILVVSVDTWGSDKVSKTIANFIRFIISIFIKID